VPTLTVVTVVPPLFKLPRPPANESVALRLMVAAFSVSSPPEVFDVIGALSVIVGALKVRSRVVDQVMPSLTVMNVVAVSVTLPLASAISITLSSTV
jgi:hypothetical protein